MQWGPDLVLGHLEWGWGYRGVGGGDDVGITILCV